MGGLYERDFNCWVKEQVALLEARAFERLDLAHLIDGIAGLARSQRTAIRNDLILVLTHLLTWRYQAERRSPGWTGSIVEHRRRIRDEIEDSPSLAGYPGEVLDRCNAARASKRRPRPAYRRRRSRPSRRFTLKQAREPGFLPD